MFITCLHSWSTHTISLQSLHSCISCLLCRYLQWHGASAEAWSPRAIRINGWRYSGMLEADLVVRAVCSGFIHMHLGFSYFSYGPEASSCAEACRGTCQTLNLLSLRSTLFAHISTFESFSPFFCRIAGLLYPIYLPVSIPHYSPFIEFSTLHSPLPSVPIFKDILWRLSQSILGLRRHRVRSAQFFSVMSDVAWLPLLWTFLNPPPHFLFSILSSAHFASECGRCYVRIMQF